MGDKPWLWNRTCDDQPVMRGFRPAFGYDPRALADIFEQITEMRRAKTALPVLKSPRQGDRYRRPLDAPPWRRPANREKHDG